MRTSRYAPIALLATLLASVPFEPTLRAQSDAATPTASGGTDGGMNGSDRAPTAVMQKTFPAPFPLDPMVARDIEAFVGAIFQRSGGFDFRYIETFSAFQLVADEPDFMAATGLIHDALGRIGQTPGARSLYGNGRFDLRSGQTTLAELAKRLRAEFGVNIVIGDESSLDFVVPPLELVNVDARIVVRLLESLPPSGGRVLVVRETANATETTRGSGTRNGRAEGFVVFADRAQAHAFETLIENDVSAELADRWVDVIAMVAELEGVTDLVKARYHEPTGIFFVRVPVDAQNAIESAMEIARTRVESEQWSREEQEGAAG